MKQLFFDNIYRNLHIPVVVCKRSETFPIVYMNPGAKILITPQASNFLSDDDTKSLSVYDIFELESITDGIISSVSITGFVADFATNIKVSANKLIPATVSAALSLFEGDEYIVLYLFMANNTATNVHDWDKIISMIWNISNNTADINSAINNILALVGDYISLDYIYIFEDISEKAISVSYRWHGKNVVPTINLNEKLIKSQCWLGSVLREGMYVSSDPAELSENKMLLSKGVKSLAVLELTSFGYIAFVNCENQRFWNNEALDFVTKISFIISSLLKRRSIDMQTEHSLEVIKAFSDGIDNLIYVNYLDSFELIFANQAFADSFSVSVDEIIGKSCWQVIQLNQTGQCDFCPLKNMLDENGNIIKNNIVWEFQNTVTGKWFLVRDSIVKWLDGKNVHIETATEITEQKLYEEQLKISASIDSMTGTYVREWGRKLMADAVAEEVNARQPLSICFIDLDGLKATNDTYGHDFGDDMLKTTINLIRSGIRKSDLITRWGGDEFVVLLRCDESNAYKIMDKIQVLVSSYNKTSEKPYDVSFSYGVIGIPVDRKDFSLDEYINTADQSMYENKMNKRRNKTNR